MSGDHKKAYIRSVESLTKLEYSRAKLHELPATQVERTYHWDGFLQHNKNATSALIRSAILRVETRGIGHRLKNEQRNSSILAYLLHSRNAAEHADEHGDLHPNRFHPASINIGGAIQVSGNSSITISNSTINGRPINGHFEVRNGGHYASYDGHVPVRAEPNQIVLSPVYDQNKKEFVFPFNEVPNLTLPELYAVDIAFDWLKTNTLLLEEH